MASVDERIAKHIADLGADRTAPRAESYLVRWYAARAVPALIKATRSRNSTRRWRAAWVLAYCRRAEARAVLDRLLDDPVEGVRYEAVSACGLLKDPSDVHWLLDLVRHDAQRSGDQQAVVTALLRMDAAGLDDVLAFAKDTDDAVRGTVAWYADCMLCAKDPAPVLALIEHACLLLARDSCAEVRVRAVAALGEVGSGLAREAVRRAAGDTDPVVRHTANWWLSKWEALARRAEIRARRGARP